MKAQKKIDLQKYQGYSALYTLNPPYNDHTYVAIVSDIRGDYNGAEQDVLTLMYPVDNFSANKPILAEGKFSTHEALLSSLGYDTERLDNDG